MSVIFGKSLQEHFGAVPSRTALPTDAFKRGGRDNERFFGRSEKPAGYIILPEASYDAFASASEGGKKVGSYKVFNTFPVGSETLDRLRSVATSEIQVFPDRASADELADYKNWTSQIESRDLIRSQPVALWQKHEIRYETAEQPAAKSNVVSLTARIQ